MHELTESEKALYYEAIAIHDPARRNAYLDAVFGQDSDLRSRIQSLLDADDNAGSFLSAPPLGSLLASLDSTPEFDRSGDAAGETVGRYKLLEQIGVGGFGVVYMAEQREPIQRRVALKIIKEGMDTKQVIARFEAERQALSLMNHPNIAIVLDAGTTDAGRPFFVMELVRGVPVTEYCSEHNLSIEERLIVFSNVCAAVQHAHQKGVIHRDIKPSNVLVTTDGNRPLAKVIDFGIAKATQGRLTDKTLFTQFRQFIGTPAYMSPEQAQMSAHDVDTRTDVYSLGVLLYELLTGTTPLDVETMKQAALDEICRSIREEEPPKPSARLSSLTQAQRGAIARQRRADPEKLHRLICGELDWIVMRAIEKDRSRRYGSAVELAADIARYLADEPVSAGPPSASYRLRKFASRYRVVASMSAAIALALIAGTVISTFGLVEARRAQRRLEVAQEDLTDQLAETQEARQKSYDNLYISDMNRAAIAYDECDISLALSLLAKHEAVYSDRFEWKCIFRLCQEGDALYTFRGHAAPVNNVAISQNGVIASGSANGMLRLVDVNTMTETAIQRMESGIERLAFTADGLTLAVLEENNKVTLWKVEPLQQIAEFPQERPAFSDIEFTPNGAALALATTSMWESSLVWNWESGDLRQILPKAGKGKFLSVSPLGNLISLVGPATQVHVAAPADDHFTRYVTMNHAHDWHLEDSAFSPPDGKYLATAAGGGIKIWDVAEAHQGPLDGSPVEPVAILQHQRSSHGSRRLAFSPDGQFLASAGSKGNVNLWRGRPPWHPEEAELLTLRGHSARVNSVCYSPDGRFIVTGSDDHTVKVWPGDGRSDSLASAQAEDWIYTVAFSPDDRTLAAGGFDGRVRLYDTDTLELRFDKQLHENQVLGVAISPDGKWMASCEGAWRAWGSYGEPGKGVSLLNLMHPDRQYYFFVEGLASVKGAIDFSPDGHMLVIGDDNGHLWLWDVEAQRIVKQSAPDEEAPNKFWHARYSPGGAMIAALGSKGLELRDAESLEVKHVFREASAFGTIDFSANGQLLACREGQRIIVLNASDLSDAQTFEGHPLAISRVAYLRDGKTLASSGRDGTVRLWNFDLGAGQEVATLRGHRGNVTGLAVSHNGTMLASSGDDKTIRIWRAGQLSNKGEESPMRSDRVVPEP